MANDKVERVKTGGGVFISQVDAVDEKVLALLGNRATPLINQFDSDAVYNNEKGISELDIIFIIFLELIICINKSNSNYISFRKLINKLL